MPFPATKCPILYGITVQDKITQLNAPFQLEVISIRSSSSTSFTFFHFFFFVSFRVFFFFLLNCPLLLQSPSSFLLLLLIIILFLLVLLLLLLFLLVFILPFHLLHLPHMFPSFSLFLFSSGPVLKIIQAP